MFRFAVLYFVMLVVFLALVVGPAVAGRMIPFELEPVAGFRLMQPTGFSNDDTAGKSATGTARIGYTGAFTPTSAAEVAASSSAV